MRGMLAQAEPMARDRTRWLWSLLGAGRVPPAARPKLAIVALLYFIQGSPVSVLWEVLPVYFRLQGVSLRAIGGLRLLELPFSLKVLWSPLVQRFGDRRGWVLACMLVVAAAVVALPWLDAAHPGLGLLLRWTHQPASASRSRAAV